MEQRLRNFQYKLTQIETYNTLSGSLTDDSGSLKDIKNWESQINDIKNNFDGFEKYMYHESSSYITSSLGEFYDNSWPKVSGDGSVRSPYVLAHTTSSEGLNWFNENITSASLYDEENINKLSTLLPDHIKFDTNNETYIKFTDMVAHHFDNIWFEPVAALNLTSTLSGFLLVLVRLPDHGVVTNCPPLKSNALVNFLLISNCGVESLGTSGPPYSFTLSIVDGIP